MMSEESSTMKRAESNHVQSWERFERKFFIPPSKIAFAHGLLRHICLRDRDYPEGRVNSLYFDTPDLDQFWQSDNGDYERKKFRIRWYGDLRNHSDMIPVFPELKAKRGFASRKQRRRILVPVQQLAIARLSHGIVKRNLMIRVLSEFGHFPEEPLQPVIVISYERVRFSEILTGARVSLDCKIRSSFVAPGLGHGEADLMLEGAVLEIKSLTTEMPGSLRSISVLGTDWTRFSKYANCIESQMAIPGSTGRFWPSGTIQPT